MLGCIRMKKQLFIVGCILIVCVSLLTHLLPAFTNSFYFTMDQGRDAVYVREILTRGKILLQGPETSTPGVYHGPLWNYFIAIGYGIFGGHPFGAVFMLIALQIVAFLAIHIKKYAS